MATSKKPTSPEESRDMVGISRCWQNSGWHAHGAGPCFAKYEQAIVFRDLVERVGWVEARRRYGS